MSMSGTFDFNAVGLGISFEQPLQHGHQQVIAGHQDDYAEPNHFFEQQPRPRRPKSQIVASQPNTFSDPQLRSRSAMIPQRPTFDLPNEQHFQAPRSAMPSQRPFFHSPSQSVPSQYPSSAPSTPQDGAHRRVGVMQRISQTDRRDQTRDSMHDRGQRTRPPLDTRPPPHYYNSPRFMDSPAGAGYGNSGTDNSSSNSGSSYFYMTPSIQSTPFSEAGPFPVPDTFSYRSNFNTPNMIASPIFEAYPTLSDDHEDIRRGHFEEEEEDEMPEEPYVPTVMTNFPPIRPSALRRTTTDDAKYTFEIEDRDRKSMYTSPSSSPPCTPQLQKDRKVTYSRWTSSEDGLLKEAIAKHGDGKWSLVSQMVPGRTPMQCSTRWQGALNTSIHKGRWDPEEDAILIRSVAEWQAWHLSDNKDQPTESLQEELYKNIPWSNIAQLLPRPRTGVQALARWSEALDPRITKGKWTDVEDAALLKGVAKYGKCWIKIANGVRGRTQRQCRTRYCQISDKKRKVRGGPIARAGSPSDPNYSD